MSSWLTTYNLPPSTYHLKPITYNLKLPPTTYHRQGESGKLYYFLEFKFLQSDRPSSSPVELPGTMLSMKFCIEWCKDQGLLSPETSKFLGSGSWVSRVSPHIQILRSWVFRVSRQKGRARSKIHQGPRPWTQRTQDLEPFWNLGTSLVSTTSATHEPRPTTCHCLSLVLPNPPKSNCFVFAERRIFPFIRLCPPIKPLPMLPHNNAYLDPR